MNSDDRTTTLDRSTTEIMGAAEAAMQLHGQRPTDCPLTWAWLFEVLHAWQTGGTAPAYLADREAVERDADKLARNCAKATSVSMRHAMRMCAEGWELETMAESSQTDVPAYLRRQLYKLGRDFLVELYTPPARAHRSTMM